MKMRKVARSDSDHFSITYQKFDVRMP